MPGFYRTPRPRPKLTHQSEKHALEAFVLLVLVTAELFLLFRPDDNEALATFVAIWVLLIMFRRITRGIGGEFDWRQRVAGLSVIPVVLGFVVGASFFVLGILLQSIWPNTVSQVQVIKLIGRSFLQAAVLLPTYVAGILIATTITVYLERLLRRARVPELGIIAELQILLAMSLNGGRWVEFRHKRELLRRLETAAYCIEGGLPKRLRTGDIATDNWHRDQARQMAAAFRQLKRLVVNPGLESRAQFVQRIMDSYTYAVRGEWGLLDKREPEVTQGESK